jgi:hypothetical protein
MNDPDFASLLSRVEYQYDVFISYSSVQESEARAIYESLRSEMKVFFAPESLNELDYEPGQYVGTPEKGKSLAAQLVSAIESR